MNPLLARALLGAGFLLLVQAVAATSAWLSLRATAGRPAARATALVGLLAAYHAAVWLLLPQRIVLLMDIFFIWVHLGFVFRFLSSIYYHRRGGPVPGFVFHVAVVVAGPGQAYEAGSWKELRGERLSLRLIGEWLRHAGHALVVAAAGAALIAVGTWWDAPFAVRLVRGGFGLIALQILTVCADLQTLAWSVGGCHRSFFGRFPFFRARHVGEFWTKWNIYAVRAFRELTVLLRLRDRPVTNTIVVFAVSGLLHQVTFLYYTRSPACGTMIAFFLNAVGVLAFTRLYYLSGRGRARFSGLLFNPVVTAILVIVLSQPMAWDFRAIGDEVAGFMRAIQSR